MPPRGVKGTKLARPEEIAARTVDKERARSDQAQLQRAVDAKKR